jgi:cobalt-zinc-cadmium efflux system outer membrane protein
MRRWHSITAAALVASSGALAAAQHEVAPLPPLREHASTARPALFQADAPADAPQPVESSTQPPRVAEPEKLTLADAEQFALANHPALARASARVMAARGAWVQAGLLPNPKAGYSGEEMGDEDTAGKQGGFLAQEFVTGGKRGLNRAVASQEIRHAEAELETMRQRVVSDVRMAFYDALVAQQTVRMVEDLVRISSDGVKSTESLLEHGELTRVELLQARIEANSTQLLLDESRNRDVAARRQLAALMATDDRLPELTGDAWADLPNFTWDDAVAGLLADSPEIAAAQALVDKAGWEVSRARAERIPNIDAQVSVHRDNVTQDNVAGLEIGLPLPIFDRNQGGIQKAQAELSAAHSNVVRVEQGLKRRLAATFESYDNARRRVAEYKNRILPDAKESLELVTAGYRSGDIGYLTLLTAQRTYIQTHLSHLEALRQLRQATTSIETMLLSESLEDR